MSSGKTAGRKKVQGANAASTDVEMDSETELAVADQPVDGQVSREVALEAAVVALQSATKANTDLARALTLIH